MSATSLQILWYQEVKISKLAPLQLYYSQMQNHQISCNNVSQIIEGGI